MSYDSVRQRMQFTTTMLVVESNVTWKLNQLQYEIIPPDGSNITCADGEACTFEIVIRNESLNSYFREITWNADGALEDFDNGGIYSVIFKTSSTRSRFFDPISRWGSRRAQVQYRLPVLPNPADTDPEYLTSNFNINEGSIKMNSRKQSRFLDTGFDLEFDVEFKIFNKLQRTEAYKISIVSDNFLSIQTVAWSDQVQLPMTVQQQSPPSNVITESMVTTVKRRIAFWDRNVEALYLQVSAYDAFQNEIMVRVDEVA
jgi:hypothetical protein